MERERLGGVGGSKTESAMSIHPQEHVPITQSSKRTRRPDLALPLALLTLAIMIGIGVTAFSGMPNRFAEAPTTVGQATR